MDLKINRPFLEKYFWVQLFRVEAFYIVLATSFFWLDLILFNKLWRILFDFLGSIAYVLFLALTPSWFDVSNKFYSWLMGATFVAVIHTGIYVLRLPRWVFWLSVVIFFGIVFTDNMFHMEPI